MNSLGKVLLSSLGVVFLQAVLGRAQADPPQPENPLQGTAVTRTAAQPGHTYWKDRNTGGIIDIWRCPQSGLCMKNHFVDAANPETRKQAAKHLEVRPEDLSDNDVQRLCGFGPRLFDMKEQPMPPDGGAIGHWKGKFKISLDALRGKGNKEGRTFGVEIRQSGDRLRMEGWIDNFFLKMFKQSIELERVADPPPACVPPPPSV